MVVRKYATLQRGLVCGKIKKKVYYLPYQPPHGPHKIWAGLAKNYFFNFCYLIRVDHEKCSEMCV
jgi:hypothetical protein